MNQEGYGLGGIFRKIGRFFKPLGRELGNIGLTVGVDLIQSLINDLIAGKSTRASAKAHGRQSAQRATDLATIRALQLIKERQQQQQQGGTWFDRDLSDPPLAVRGLAKAKQKGGKRKRSQSANQPTKKRKRSRSVRKRKTTQQKGGNLIKDLYRGYMNEKRKGEEERKRKRKRKAKKKGGRKKPTQQRGGRKSGRLTKRRKPTKRRTVVSAKRMSVKQRKALPRDIFG